MLRLAINLLFVALPSMAMAAGDVGDQSWYVLLAVYGPAAMLVLLPATGFGFFLQGFLSKFRYGFGVYVACWLALLGACVVTEGVAKTINVSPLVAVMFLLSSPAFVSGWYLGIKDAQRTAHKKLA